MLRPLAWEACSEKHPRAKAWNQATWVCIPAFIRVWLWTSDTESLCTSVYPRVKRSQQQCLLPEDQRTQSTGMPWRILASTITPTAALPSDNSVGVTSYASLHNTGMEEGP